MFESEPEGSTYTREDTKGSTESITTQMASKVEHTVAISTESVKDKPKCDTWMATSWVQNTTNSITIAMFTLLGRLSCDLDRLLGHTRCSKRPQSAAPMIWWFKRSIIYIIYNITSTHILYVCSICIYTHRTHIHMHVYVGVYIYIYIYIYVGGIYIYIYKYAYTHNIYIYIYIIHIRAQYSFCEI